MRKPLVKEFEYNVPVTSVWQALTETDKMKQWYFPQLQKFELVAGYKFQFADDSSDYRKEWIVTQVEEGKTFAHSWAYKGFPGCSEVIFDLVAAGSKTKLNVTQTNLDSFPNHPHFKRERFEWGWENLLGQNLKHLLDNISPF